MTTDSELETLRTEALAACRKARATSNGNWLLDVHDAGVLLGRIEPERGRRKSSDGLTIYQTVTRDAQISRETANQWKKVGRIPREFVERYIAEKRSDATITGLFAAFDPSNQKGSERRHTVSFQDGGYDRFVYQVKALADHRFGTTSFEDAIVCAVDEVFKKWMASR